MSRKDGKDYIYLIWKDPKSRRQYRVGQLSKNGQYEFEYGFEIQEALKKGFELLISFDSLGKRYSSDKLFSPFRSRVPDRRRKGINNILEKYGLTEYSEYQLLKKSGGRLPIDTMEFIDPILDNGEEPIERNFYIAGARHYIGCNGTCCDKSIDLSNEEKLYLELEPTNEYDRYAVKINNENNVLVGYMPRYYSESVFEFITKGAKYQLEVSDINKNADNCNECVRAYLKINRS
ncbi:HIRAN domain-containing protein [Clostridium butyricum]|uniref:HIRAN domain-containing protein n=1 Tax=Clostridium butyricum TaxID=1492 RepID=UPI00129BAA0B|nr:HIRAN domain-containing protein [Clostridium butyricum]QGH20890.1 DNA-binding protein [Clostridium butyricum]QGH24931.1 DNA-binding protein [Clostridium butyricum]